MQKLLRKDDAPTASNGGLSTPRSLDHETSTSLELYGQSYDGLNQILTEFQIRTQTAATQTESAGRPGKEIATAPEQIQRYLVYTATNTISKLLVFQKRRCMNRPLPPLPCVLDFSKARE